MSDTGEAVIRRVAVLTACLIPLLAAGARAEEVYLHDGRRLMGMVESIDAAGAVAVRLADGTIQSLALVDVTRIRFRGREPRAIRAGSQEFHMVSGDRIRGEIVRLAERDVLTVRSQAAGEVGLPMAAIRGFLTMPVAGSSGRRAVELVTGDEDEPAGMLDQVLDRRGAGYQGVTEAIDAENLTLDHERMRQSVPLKILYLAGVRLAASTRAPAPPLPDAAFLKVHTRDGSAIDGLVRQVADGRWQVHPRWQPEATLSLAVEEITEVEVLNGRLLYLSQLTPVRAAEQTTLAPRQPYRLNANCLGGPMRIGGDGYAWGVGVHAASELTFDVGGRWSTFESVLGLDDQASEGGSVVFTVLGDGRQLFRSTVVRRTDAQPATVSVPIRGVQKLTIKVEATDDLDLGDAANWADARLVR